MGTHDVSGTEYFVMKIFKARLKHVGGLKNNELKATQGNILMSA